MVDLYLRVGQEGLFVAAEPRIDSHDAGCGWNTGSRRRGRWCVRPRTRPSAAQQAARPRCLTIRLINSAGRGEGRPWQV